jgi:hypothetical protein
MRRINQISAVHELHDRLLARATLTAPKVLFDALVRAAALCARRLETLKGI